MSTEATTRIADRLASVVGSEHVVTDRQRLDYLSQDLSFEDWRPADVAVAPGSTAELSEIVQTAHAAGAPVLVRGGGMSYTRGFTPLDSGAVLVDMRRMNSIREINLQDGYVTVECGATWEQVYTALREKGVRTPYYGPLSGRYATVGGALSQNSVFWGAARAGTVADSVLTLEVVAGDGKVRRTGTAGRSGSSPFNRYFGPDLAGMFIGDTGAMGIKAAATLRTQPFPEHTLHHSIAVTDFSTAICCMESIGRYGIATEIYNLDPFYADSMVKAGIEQLREHPWTVHLSVDGATAEIAEAGMAKLREVAAAFGETIDPVVPEVFRSDPFGSVQAVLLGPEGQIWLPIHAFLPFSRAQEAAAAVKAFEDANRATYERHGIKMSYLTVCSGNDFLFEPSFYWFDELGEFRLERIAEESAADWRSIRPDVDARTAVLGMRRELAKVFDGLGAAHIQIAKYYDYAPMLEAGSLDLVRAFKQATDPKGLMNPGALGL